MREFEAERAAGSAAASYAEHARQQAERFGGYWATPAGFLRYLAELCGQEREDWPRPEGYVPATTLWWVDGTEYLGRVSIRHRLNPRLLEVSGHIGYDVRPSARRRGHATAMLRAALPVAAALGIDPVLVTCDAGNIGSLKVIEANGGKLENRRGTKLRFWIQAVARPGPGHPVAAPT